MLSCTSNNITIRYNEESIFSTTNVKSFQNLRNIFSNLFGTIQGNWALKLLDLKTLWSYFVLQFIQRMYAIKISDGRSLLGNLTKPVLKINYNFEAIIFY